MFDAKADDTQKILSWADVVKDKQPNAQGQIILTNEEIETLREAKLLPRKGYTFNDKRASRNIEPTIPEATPDPLYVRMLNDLKETLEKGK